MNYRVIARILAGVVLALRIMLLIPLLVSFIYGDGSWESFIVPASLMVLVGGIGFRAARPSSPRAYVYVGAREVLFGHAGLGARRGARRDAVPDLGHFLEPCRLHLRGHERLHHHRGYAAGERRGPDPLRSVLALHDPVARRDRHRGPLRGRRAGARVRGGEVAFGGSLRHRPAQAHPPHRRHRQGTLDRVPGPLFRRDRLSATGRDEPLRCRGAHVYHHSHGRVQPRVPPSASTTR